MAKPIAQEGVDLNGNIIENEGMEVFDVCISNYLEFYNLPCRMCG